MDTITEQSIIHSVMEIESGRDFKKTGIPHDNDINGGLTDPSFDGHWTNWGVTLATLQDHGYNVHPRDLTFRQAYDFYKTIFFTRSGAAAVLPHHPPLARVIFNYGVHAGYRAGASKLQMLLNIHNNRGKRWPELIEDGWAGSKTVDALTAYMRLRDNKLGEDVIFCDYLIAMGAHYQLLARKNDKYEKYTYGWSTRIRRELRVYFTGSE